MSHQTLLPALRPGVPLFHIFVFIALADFASASFLIREVKENDSVLPVRATWVRPEQDEFARRAVRYCSQEASSDFRVEGVFFPIIQDISYIPMALKTNAPSFTIIRAIFDGIYRFLIVHDNDDGTLVPNFILVGAIFNHFPRHASICAHECVAFIIWFQIPANITHSE